MKNPVARSGVSLYRISFMGIAPPNPGTPFITTASDAVFWLFPYKGQPILLQGPLIKGVDNWRLNVALFGCQGYQWLIDRSRAYYCLYSNCCRLWISRMNTAGISKNIYGYLWSVGDLKFYNWQSQILLKFFSPLMNFFNDKSSGYNYSNSAIKSPIGETS